MEKLLKNILYNHWGKVVLALLICIYSITLGSLSVLRHNAFASGYDLSNMDQTLWYTLNGHFFSLRDPDDFVSRFSIHADLMLVLLSPLYLIKDDIRMLLVAQSVFLALGAIPVYLLSQKILKNRFVSLVISSVYLLSPGLQWSNIYDFHAVTLAIPLLLASFYTAFTKKWKWYFLFISLALITKENISLSIAMLGFYIFFILKDWKIGLITIFIGISWFILMVYFVMPYFTKSGVHWALQGEQGGLPAGVSQFGNPSFITEKFFFDKYSWNYYILLLKQFAFLPLVALPWMFISAPELAINVLRSKTMINFHYDSGIIPGLVISTIFAISYIRTYILHFRFLKPYANKMIYVLSIGLLIFALRVNYHYGPLPITPSCWCYIYQVTKEDIAFEKQLQNIPKTASITSSLEIRPHINHRELAFSVPSATSSAEYIVLITQNRIVGNYEPKELENKLIPTLLSNKKYTLLFKSKHFYLFKNNQPEMFIEIN